MSVYFLYPPLNGTVIVDKRFITRRVRRARDLVRKSISDSIHRDSPFSAALAWEGYAGGYYHALNDVLLMLESDTIPTRQDF